MRWSSDNLESQILIKYNLSELPADVEIIIGKRRKLHYHFLGLIGQNSKLPIIMNEELEEGIILDLGEKLLTANTNNWRE